MHAFAKADDIEQSVLAATYGDVLLDCVQSGLAEDHKDNLDKQWNLYLEKSKKNAQPDRIGDANGLEPIGETHQTLKPKHQGSCTYDFDVGFHHWEMTVPNGAAYNDPNRHCGSGFLDNLRALGVLDWKCEELPLDEARGMKDVKLSFVTSKFVGEDRVQSAILGATYGDVHLPCANTGFYDRYMSGEKADSDSVAARRKGLREDLNKKQWAEYLATFE